MTGQKSEAYYKALTAAGRAHQDSPPRNALDTCQAACRTYVSLSVAKRRDLEKFYAIEVSPQPTATFTINPDANNCCMEHIKLKIVRPA